MCSMRCITQSNRVGFDHKTKRVSVLVPGWQLWQPWGCCPTSFGEGDGRTLSVATDNQLHQIFLEAYRCPNRGCHSDRITVISSSTLKPLGHITTSIAISEERPERSLS